MTIRVTPGARANRIQQADAGGLRIRLQAPPVEGKANEALVEFLAEKLATRARNVQLVAGARSRTKQVRVIGIEPDAVRRRLAGGGETVR